MSSCTSNHCAALFKMCRLSDLRLCLENGGLEVVVFDKTACKCALIAASTRLLVT